MSTVAPIQVALASLGQCLQRQELARGIDKVIHGKNSIRRGHEPASEAKLKVPVLIIGRSRAHSP